MNDHVLELYAALFEELDQFPSDWMDVMMAKLFLNLSKSRYEDLQVKLVAVCQPEQEQLRGIG